MKKETINDILAGLSVGGIVGIVLLVVVIVAKWLT